MKKDREKELWLLRVKIYCLLHMGKKPHEIRKILNIKKDMFYRLRIHKYESQKPLKICKYQYWSCKQDYSNTMADQEFRKQIFTFLRRHLRISVFDIADCFYGCKYCSRASIYRDLDDRPKNF